MFMPMFKPQSQLIHILVITARQMVDKIKNKVLYVCGQWVDYIIYMMVTMEWCHYKYVELIINLISL